MSGLLIVIPVPDTLPFNSFPLAMSWVLTLSKISTMDREKSHIYLAWWSVQLEM